MTTHLTDLVTSIAQRARTASFSLAVASTASKNSALDALSELIIRDSDKILEANQKDLAGAKEAGLSMAQIDRLTLNPVRISKLAQSVKDVALLPDPVGEVLEKWNQPNQRIHPCLPADWIQYKQCDTNWKNNCCFFCF